MATIYRGVLKAYTPGSFLATVQIEASTSQNVTNVPVSRDLDAQMVVGRNLAVVIFDERNPRDGCVVAVYT